MKDIFTSEFFINNRRAILKSANAKLIVLAANGALQRSADTTFPFRQDSNFWYLTGVEEPDFVLVVTADEEYLIEPKRSEHRDLWDGAINFDHIKSRSGIDEIYDYHKGWNKLDKQIKQFKKVHTIAPAESYFEHFGFYANPARGVLLGFIEKHRQVQVVDIRKALARLRQIKQPAEIEAIQKAIDITLDSLGRVKKKITSYKTENEIVADISRDFLRAGIKGHAYSPIVAFGRNATTIHYVDNNSGLEKSGLVLLDVGAEVDNYSADITRTFSLGKPSKREKEVYGAVSSVKDFASKNLKPGIKMRQFEKQVDTYMGKQLKKLGLISDASDKKGIKKYYPHLVSHFLGLDTHDAADYDMPLEPGMVLTIEPGIYIPEEGIGIRLEDDMLITEKGCINLSQSLPVDLS